MKSIAIVYHYLAHYRNPIFSELCSNSNPIFTLISGDNDVSDIKTIDKVLANVNINEGGLRWLFVKNIWIIREKLLWQKGMIQICNSNKFDGYIFLGNPYFISTWVATILLKIKKKPVYFWTHGLLKKEKSIKGFIRRVFYKLPDGLLLYGKYARQLLIKQGFHPETLHVIYNSLDYKKQIQLRETLSNEALVTFRSQFFNNPSLPQLIFIGRLTEQKKLTQLIEAMCLLHQKGFKLNLLFVGNGDEKQKLQKSITERKLEDFVFFYGESYNEEDNYKLIASSDICVSPGEVGLTAMHSLVYGTPVITHNNFEEQMPEFEAIKPDISGDFFEQNNIIDLANKIEKWLINNTDKIKIRSNCYRIIDTKYNPQYQREVICNIVIK